MRRFPVWAALPVLVWCAAAHSQEGTEIAPPADLRAPGIATNIYTNVVKNWAALFQHAEQKVMF